MKTSHDWMCTCRQSRNPGPWISRLVALLKISELCLADEPWSSMLWWLRMIANLSIWALMGKYTWARQPAPSRWGLEKLQATVRILYVASPALQQTLSPTPHRLLCRLPTPKSSPSPALKVTWWYHSAKFTEGTPVTALDLLLTPNVWNILAMK